MVHEDCPAGVIITGGLGGDYNQWIIAQFHLFLGVGSPPLVEVDVRIVGSAGGATTRPPIYYPPREDDTDEPWKPREDNEQEVIIRVRIGGREVQRNYFVRKRTEAVMIQVINMVNVTMKRVSISLNKITETSKSAVVALKNLGRKKK